MVRTIQVLAVLAPLLAAPAGAAVQPGEGQWFAGEVIGVDAHGSEGQDIGNVEDLILDREGMIHSIVISAGGLLGLGDTEVAVPWEQAQVTPGTDAVQVPLEEEAWAGFHVGEEIEGVLLGEMGLWRLRDLEGAQAMMFGDEDFGTVQDAVFNEHSQLVAIVVQSEESGASYAVPRTELSIGSDLGYVRVEAEQPVDLEEWRVDLTPQPYDLGPVAAMPDRPATENQEAEEARLAREVEQWESRVQGYARAHGPTGEGAEELVWRFQTLKQQLRKLRQVEGANWLREREFYDEALDELRQQWAELADEPQ